VRRREKKREKQRKRESEAGSLAQKVVRNNKREKRRHTLSFSHLLMNRPYFCSNTINKNKKEQEKRPHSPCHPYPHPIQCPFLSLFLSLSLSLSPPFLRSPTSQDCMWTTKRGVISFFLCFCPRSSCLVS
jgi:hypothetical protein